MDDRKNQNREPEKGSGGGPKNRQTILIILICLLVSLMVMGLLNNALGGITSEDLDYSKFLDMVNNDGVQEVVLKSGTLTVTPKDQKSEGITYQVTMMGDEQELVDLLQEKGITYHKDPPDSTGTIIYTLLTVILPVVMLVAVMVWVMRSMNKGGGVMGVGKSRAKAYVQKETGVTFRDVAGQDEAKESLQEVVDFLHNPGKYTTIGAKLPKGALLVGPPGTGKTLLAKAVAGEAHVPFFSMSASEFVEMFVGVGASRVRDLFEEAKKNAPCIIFIDEIDAIGKSRDNSYNSNDEREQTLNQLLAEMDGFDSSKGILILAATNRPEVLDPALLRPGRFDRRIIVERPDLKGRVEILKVHAKNVSLDETVDLDGIALATSGAVGSDLANMINEAALAAVKAGREAVSQKDLLEAVEVVIAGKEKKDRILGEEEKKIVSYHEVGHAMAIAVQKNTEPVQKITIIPRTMGALGYTMQVPEEEKYLMSKEQMLSELVTLFGGRAAEEVVFNSVTTGASNDIERATQIARAMVTQYGMSERFGLMGLESVQNRYLDGRAVMNCSDATGALIDEEVKEMLKVAYDKAKKIIEDHREVMDEIAEFLIEKETITGKEFMEIYNKSLKKDELESVEANVEEDKEKTELSEAETVSEESSLKDAESQDAQKVTEKKDSEQTKQEE